MTQSSNLLTSAQVAEMLGKSVRTVHRMAEAGDLTIVTKLPVDTGAYLFDRKVIEKLAKAA